MNSHLTAISRNALPVPVRWLLKNGMLHGNVLDFGCGKCRAVNEKVFPKVGTGVTSITSYDPHYEPNAIKESGKLMWDVVLCTYVLCTLPESEERGTLREIQKYISPSGVAFISVRADEPKNGYGQSSKGTFQRAVFMPYLYELRKTSQYRIYLLTKERFLRVSQ